MSDENRPRYRVFFREDEAPAMPDGVTIEAVYPAFIIVTATGEAVEALSKQYPVEEMKEPKGKPEVPAVAGLRDAIGAPQKRGPYTMVVRFRGPVRPAWIEAVKASDCTYLQAISSTHVVVRCPNKPSLVRLQKLPFVEQATERYVPTIRVSSSFERLIKGGEHLDAPASGEADALPESSDDDRVLTGLLVADFFSEEERDLAARRLHKRGISPVEAAGKTLLVFDLSEHPHPDEAIQAIAVRRGLRSLEEQYLEQTLNDEARLIVANRVARSPQPGLGLTGRDEIIAIADTGLDTGDLTNIHPDFAGRVRDIQSYPVKLYYAHRLLDPNHRDDGPADQQSGHGTHVAGSVLGNGAWAQTLGLPLGIEGVAAEALLVFQAVEQATRWSAEGWNWWANSVGRVPPPHGLFGIPDDLQDLFTDAYVQGARIHSNSWNRRGVRANGAYNKQSRAIDHFVWDHKDFLVIAAAGNAGMRRRTVRPPGTAKNCLTVGACENRAVGHDEVQGINYADGWPSASFPEPFQSDVMTDDINDIAPFSSRGPCRTGRRKPDVVAPGTFVLSTRSRALPDHEVGLAAFEAARRDYMYNSGTSMATPLVAGCAALVRQYLRGTIGIDDPSAALVKAVLIHSAQHTGPPESRWADNAQGWGRVDLQQVLNPPVPVGVRFLDQQPGLVSNERFQVEIAITDDTANLRLTMVYSDFPREELVNNLNLIAWSPTGRFFVGNDFGGAGSPDDTNNVEGIVVEQPDAGLWTIDVVASSVPEGPQDFALVISGGGLS